MATLEEIVIQLTAETNQLRAEMASAAKAVEKNTEKMDKAIEEFSKNGSKSTSFLQNAFSTMAGFLGSSIVTSAYQTLISLGKGLVDTLIEQGQSAIKDDEAMRGLAQSLAATGNYSRAALDQLSGVADELDDITRAGGEVITSQIQLLSAMTKMNSDGLEASIRLAADFAAAYNKELGPATDAIGKAINGNGAAFKKLGVDIELTSSKTENLKRIQEALAGTQGAAAEKSRTFAGEQYKLTKSYEDTFKEVSKTIMQNQVLITVMNEITKIFKEAQTYIANNADTIREGLGNAIIFAIDLMAAFTIAVQALSKVISVAFAFATIPIKNMIDAVQTLYDVLTGDWAGAAKNIGEIFDNFAKPFREMADDTSMLDPVIDGLANIRGAATQTLNTVGGAAAGIGESIKNAATTASDSTSQLSEHQKQIQSWALELAKYFNDVNNKMTTQKEALAMQLEEQSITQADYFAGLLELQSTQFQMEQDQLQSALDQKLISIQQYNDARKALEEKNSAAIAKIEFEKNKQRAADYRDTMNVISGLANSSSKELAAIGKASAIYTATIDGYAAVQKALASAPPPFNFGLAALVGAATASNVAKIAGVTGLESGITDVPRSAAGGNLGDNFPAMLKSGERVVDSDTNQDLKKFLSGQSQGSAVNINLTVMPNTGLNNDQIGNLIEQINEYFRSGGLPFVKESVG